MSQQNKQDQNRRKCSNIRIMKENKGIGYRGSNLHLHNIVAIITNHRIPCARVNLILVPIRELATSNIKFLFHIV
jgi:hypothetical protein